VTRTTYKMIDGRIQDRDGFPLLNQSQFARTPEELCKPYIMSDIPEYKNMLNGAMITTRDAHREFLKKNNLVELGNEKLPNKKPPHAKHEIAMDIKETIDQLKAGYVNPDEGAMPAGVEYDLDSISVPDDVKGGDFLRSSVDAPLGSIDAALEKVNK